MFVVFGGGGENGAAWARPGQLSCQGGGHHPFPHPSSHQILKWVLTRVCYNVHLSSGLLIVRAAGLVARRLHQKRSQKFQSSFARYSFAFILCNVVKRCSNLSSEVLPRFSRGSTEVLARFWSPCAQVLSLEFWFL